MAKKNMMLLMAQEMCRKLVAEQTKTRLALGCDAAVIAANRVFHMGPGRAAAFAQAYNEAMEELATLFLDDARENKDAGIDYAKGKRDEVIRRIVGEEDFVPFDRFYAPVYVDELRRVRQLQVPEDKKSPAGDERASGADKEDERDGSR